MGGREGGEGEGEKREGERVVPLCKVRVRGSGAVAGTAALGTEARAQDTAVTLIDVCGVIRAGRRVRGGAVEWARQGRAGLCAYARSLRVRLTRYMW